MPTSITYMLEALVVSVNMSEPMALRKEWISLRQGDPTALAALAATVTAPEGTLRIKKTTNTSDTEIEYIPIVP